VIPCRKHFQEAGGARAGIRDTNGGSVMKYRGVRDSANGALRKAFGRKNRMTLPKTAVPTES